MTTPTIIGIAGGSGSGKTTLANTLVDRCNGSALLISHDRYCRGTDDRSSEATEV